MNLKTKPFFDFLDWAHWAREPKQFPLSDAEQAKLDDLLKAIQDAVTESIDAEIKPYKDLIVHCWVHSGFKNCGYDQMDTPMKTLFKKITGECRKPLIPTGIILLGEYLGEKYRVADGEIQTEFGPEPMEWCRANWYYDDSLDANVDVIKFREWVDRILMEAAHPLIEVSTEGPPAMQSRGHFEFSRGWVPHDDPS